MKKAIVIYPVLEKLDKNLIENKLIETCNLTEAIFLNVIHREHFILRKPEPKALMRKGKINYFLEILNEFDFKGNDNILVFAIDISPIQQRNLEKIYKIKILDKTSLILEIFGERAFSKIGRIQVELAHLSWQKSRLVRSWTHLERQRGGFGFLGGPGESQIELDKRMINKRIKQLKFLILKAKKTREIQYNNRQKKRVPVVSLLGYTNAGKSTLFNSLTKLKVSAKNKLFETLDTKISYFYLPLTKKAYINDTVGFISDLPTLLVEAFKSQSTKFLVISFSSDWLYTTKENKDIVIALNASGADVSYSEIETDKGHDSFLLNEPEFLKTLKGFLDSMYEKFKR